MSTLSERLDWILKSRAVSARALSLAAGASPSYVAQIIRGEIGEGIAYERFVSLARAGSVDTQWLITGTGDPDHTPAPTSEPIHDEALPEIDRALTLFRGKLTPDLETHIRRQHAEARAFFDGGSMGRLVTFVEDEIAKWKREHDGMPPKVQEAPATEVKVREGAMKLERKSKGQR